MKSYSSREITKMLTADGWYLHSVSGSHHHYKHLVKTGKITVPHPQKDIPLGTAKSILNQAGIRI